MISASPRFLMMSITSPISPTPQSRWSRAGGGDDVRPVALVKRLKFALHVEQLGNAQVHGNSSLLR